MDTYIVRKPILDKAHKVVAYEIVYAESQGASLTEDQEVYLANTIERFLNELSNKRFLEDKAAFLNFTPNLLMKNIPKMFTREQLVIQIDDSTIVHPVAQKIIYRLKKQGYRIALIGFEFSPRYFGIMEIVDIVRLDFSKEPRSLQNVVKIARSMEKEVAGYNINTPEAMDLAREVECDYLQGDSIAQQKVSKVQRIDRIQSNFFQLMVAVTKDDPDIDEIDAIISRDVSLAFSLMKLVNSAYFALRNRVRSVHQALVILGLGQLKQWIYLLSFSRDDGGMQDEMIKNSFLRATICQELVTRLKSFPISPAEAYLMGMFSTLGAIMEVSLETALGELPISEEIKVALLSGEGMCGELHRLITGYEQANHDQVRACAEHLGLEVNTVTQVYLDSVEAVDTAWFALQEPLESSPERENLRS